MELQPVHLADRCNTANTGIVSIRKTTIVQELCSKTHRGQKQTMEVEMADCKLRLDGGQPVHIHQCAAKCSRGALGVFDEPADIRVDRYVRFGDREEHRSWLGAVWQGARGRNCTQSSLECSREGGNQSVLAVKGGRKAAFMAEHGVAQMHGKTPRADSGQGMGGC